MGSANSSLSGIPVRDEWKIVCVRSGRFVCCGRPGSAVGQTVAFDERASTAGFGRRKPALSARTTAEKWCKVVLYSPFVIHHEGKFRDVVCRDVRGQSHARHENRLRRVGRRSRLEAACGQPHPYGARIFPLRKAFKRRLSSSTRRRRSTRCGLWSCRATITTFRNSVMRRVGMD